MSYNQFYGHIPVDFFKHVPSLTYLNLNINFLNGSIPSTLKYATQLNYLSINDNHLSGSIPSVFGYLKNLSYVDLSSNALTNTFPATSLLQANQSLEYLYLFLNRMNGSIPSDFLIIMQNLKEFSVRLNEMTGLLPFPPLQKGEEESFHCQDYADQYALQVFSVSNNYFKGSISNTVCMFTSLYYFDVEVNDLTGTLPNTLCRNMSSLITLTASGNLFHGTLPNDMFVTMEALQTVDLGYNNFNGTLPSALSKNGGFPLIFLDLSQNNFQGSIPQAFYQFTAITSLSLRSTQLMGNLSQDIKEWRVLDRLDISLNAFTGSLPSAFCELLRLQTVLIDNNLFTGPLLSCLSTMPLLGDVYFGENMFTNSLPSSIWLTPSLSYLDISSNEMDGIIVLPSALDMQYFSMTSLFLSDNMFEGDITSLLQFWMYVEDVVLDYNLISGSITEDCLSSKNIIYSLNLEHNYIHGKAI